MAHRRGLPAREPRLAIVSHDFVLEAVRLDGSFLDFAADELKRDDEIIFTAVMQDGVALQFAPEEHRSDRELVFQA